MNPKAIKVSMTTEEREYATRILVAHRNELLAATNKNKSARSKDDLMTLLTLTQTLINKINK